MDFKKTEALLKSAPQTANVRLARKRISDLKPVLAYALEEIKQLEVEERGEITVDTLTPEEMEATKNVEVQEEEVVNGDEILDPLTDETKKPEAPPEAKE